MVRSILGVIVGYLAMAVFVVASFIAATALLGPDLVYKPGPGAA